MTSAAISIVPEFTEKIELRGHESLFGITAKEITNTSSGSKILFRGIKTSSGNQTANLKSIQGVTTFVVDEAEEFVSEDDFDTIDLSVRSDKRQNRVIIILNPTTVNHWIYERWFKNSHKIEYIDGHPFMQSTHPDVLHIHSTYLDNIEHLSDSFIHAIEQMKTDNPKKYAHKIIGGWKAKQEGVVFENWIEGDFNNRLSSCIGLDYGYYPDPLAAVKVAVDKRNKKIYLKEMVYATKIDDEMIIDVLKNCSIKKRELIVCDHNEPRTTNKILKAGYNIKKARKGKGSIINDIRDILGYQLIVDPGSFNLKTELNNYVWNDKRASIPIDDFNHLLDGMRYGFRKLMGPSIVIL